MFCLDNRGFVDIGREAIDRHLALINSDREKATLGWDGADMLGINGRADEAAETYQALSTRFPHVPFVRYRYALFLDRQGRRDEATQVLLALLQDKSRLDEETREAAEEVLAIFQRDSSAESSTFA